ncbi:hypothetical protein RIF29_23874 [Crotalaria pallida]|uniref:Uncharacterized protein n=1 Tax=Crotalaria pallida TaxID=3830 RepID=A0AAN9EL62_CROPI
MKLIVFDAYFLLLSTRGIARKIDERQHSSWMMSCMQQTRQVMINNVQVFTGTFSTCVADNKPLSFWEEEDLMSCLKWLAKPTNKRKKSEKKNKIGRREPVIGKLGSFGASHRIAAATNQPKRSSSTTQV